MALIRDIDKLEPKTRESAEKAISVLMALGIRFFVNETLRTQDTQNAYYAQGREPLESVNAKRTKAGLWLITEAENKKTVTQTLKSKHIEGKAIDIVPTDKNGGIWWGAPRSEYEKIAGIMKRFGFEWGGDWKGSWDQPHYQFKE